MRCRLDSICWIRLVISSNVADDDEEEDSDDEDDDTRITTFSEFASGAMLNVVDGTEESGKWIGPGESFLVASITVAVVVSTVVDAAAVVESMSLRTTFRLRFFELLVDSATAIVVGTGDRVGEVITDRCCCDTAGE